MALPDTTLRRGRPPIPTGPEQAPPIAAKVAEAEQQIASLRHKRPEYALGVVNGIEGADARLAEVDAKLGELERRLNVLNAAHDAAVAADRRMFAAQRAALHATQVAKVKRELDARGEAAARLSKAIETATAAFRDLIEHSRQAQRANPVGGIWPKGSYCEDDKIIELVQRELWRLGGSDYAAWASGPDRPPPPFPGGEPLNWIERQPSKCPPLVERLKQASERTLSVLTGQEPK